jgi:hypothetical protein
MKSAAHTLAAVAVSERETSVADQEPEQRQCKLRRDRQVHATRQHENEYADVPERMDDVDDPPYEIGEHTTHRVLSSYLLTTTT